MTGVGEGPWRHDTPGARALAQAYRDFYDVTNAELTAYVAGHPVFGPLAAMIPEELRAQQEHESRARMEKAFAGDWEAYAKPLRQQGAHYAALGFKFSDWYDIVSVWQRAMVPRLVERHAADPKLLTAVLGSMQELLDRAMAILGRAYIDASEAQLNERRAELERWEAIFQHVAWGVVVVDAAGTVELANPAFAALCGLEQQSVVGLRPEAFFADGELERIRSSAVPVAEREGRTTYEALLRRADGSTFPAQIDAARIPSDAGGPRWALNVTDLTERKKAEALLRRSNELEEENRRIQTASRLKSEFLANMSHELRTPLNSIIGFAELLHLQQVGPMPPKQHEFVGDILTSGRHLLRLINDVLDLSKVESGTMQFRPETVDLRAIAAEVQGVLRGVVHERGIQLRTDIDPEVAEAMLDPARLKQVLYNYLSNAIKFSPAGGEVTLRVVPEGQASLKILVTDRGPGIPVELQSRLFTEFEQLDAGRSKAHAGTGLGLALTKRLVEAQGGTVGLESQPGEGATFSAILPRRASRISLPQPRRILGASPHAPRILVVEDDARDQDRIVSTLVAAGYAVDTAATGAQARQACQQRAYDAITLDLLLPDCGGLEVLAAIRRTEGNGAVPVIVISIVSEQVTAGFVVHDALPKPIDGGSLLASLGRAGISAPASGPVLVVDDDESSAKLMAETLHQLGFEAVVARDGAHALQKASEQRPAAVVLDLVMPNLDGFGFLDRFRAQPAFAKVPVLVWTMKDLGAEEHASLLERAQAVLLKDGGGAVTLAETLRGYLIHIGPPSEEAPP